MGDWAQSSGQRKAKLQGYFPVCYAPGCRFGAAVTNLNFKYQKVVTVIDNPISYTVTLIGGN
jgi:hypothetical protein